VLLPALTLKGDYIKYSNNNGWVQGANSTTQAKDTYRNTPQAFSHFTYVSSGFDLIVVDIQGVNDFYTDPQIHTADGTGFGMGNLGVTGATPITTIPTAIFVTRIAITTVPPSSQPP
jgi:hypothetical protein